MTGRRTVRVGVRAGGSVAVGVRVGAGGSVAVGVRVDLMDPAPLLFSTGCCTARVTA